MDLKQVVSEAVSAFSDEHRSALANEFNLPQEALSALEIGWIPAQGLSLANDSLPTWAAQCWTFPERDGDGNLVGVGLRYPKGDAGDPTDRRHIGKRGLTLPPGWRDLNDPIICVEGPSDVLAGRLVGLNCIGRPSNSGGAEKIARACRDRKLVVMGENDRKDDGRWPGRDGAKSLQKKLQQSLQRPIHIAFPPPEHKDLRAWVIHCINNTEMNHEE